MIIWPSSLNMSHSLYVSWALLPDYGVSVLWALLPDYAVSVLWALLPGTVPAGKMDVAGYGTHGERKKNSFNSN